MNTAVPKPRPAASSKFFMSLRDLSFWIRSAKADSLLKKLRRQHGHEEAFDRLYQTLPDPWFTADSHYRYQPLKYQVVLSMIPDRTYHRALDIGCGIGIFSRLLAERAEHVVGIDISQSAVDQAAQVSANASNVEFQQADLMKLETASMGQFDLIVMVDTIYYLPDMSDRGLQAAREQVLKMLAPGGILLLANHYYFHFDSLSRMTRKIHAFFQRANGMHLVSQRWRPFYLMSVFEREKLLA